MTNCTCTYSITAPANSSLPQQPRAEEIADYQPKRGKHHISISRPVKPSVPESSCASPTASLLDAFIIAFLLALENFPLGHVLPWYNRHLLPHNTLFTACLHMWQTEHCRGTRNFLRGCPEGDCWRKSHWGSLLSMSSWMPALVAGSLHWQS